jgi:hypothetical protein
MQFSPSNQHGNRHSTPVRRCTDDGLWLTTLGGGASAEVNMSNKTMLCAGLLAVWKRPFEWPQRADCCQFSLPPLTRQPEILNLDSCQSRPAGSVKGWRTPVRASVGVPGWRGVEDGRPPTLNMSRLLQYFPLAVTAVQIAVRRSRFPSREDSWTADNVARRLIAGRSWTCTPTI